MTYSDLHLMSKDDLVLFALREQGESSAALVVF